MWGGELVTRWAHNPEIDRSKRFSTKINKISFKKIIEYTKL